MDIDPYEDLCNLNPNNKFGELDPAWYRHEFQSITYREQLEDLGWEFWKNEG